MKQADQTDSYQIVFHAAGTNHSQRENGESWIDYWERTTQKERPQVCPCCEKKTKKDDMVVAHVFQVIENTNPRRAKYIVPTCNKCNAKYPLKNTRLGGHTFKVPTNYLILARERDD